MKNPLFQVLSLLAALLCAASLNALHAQSFNHTPPFSSTTNSKVALNIPSADLKRARVLVAARSGYRILEMTRNGTQFEAGVDFADLSLLRYRFQYETLQGKIFESQQYEIRQSSDAQLESAYKDLKKESATLKAKITQSESKLFNIRKVKAEDLAQNKNSELAQALLLVGQKEKELAELKEQRR